MSDQLNAEATVGQVKYQWLAWDDEGEGVVVMFQQDYRGRWTQYPAIREHLHGGTAETLLEETVSRWLTVSEENGHEVKRTA